MSWLILIVSLCQFIASYFCTLDGYPVVRWYSLQFWVSAFSFHHIISKVTKTNLSSPLYTPLHTDMQDAKKP